MRARLTERLLLAGLALLTAILAGHALLRGPAPGLGPPPDGEAALRRHLAAAPADSYAWARLAAVRQRRGDAAGAIHALRASVARGPFERPLAVDRLPLLAALAPPAETAAALRLAWNWDFRRTLALLPPEAHWPLYRRALGDDPDALAGVAARVGLR